MTFAMGGAPAPGSDRIPVELFQILKDDAVESAALNMQYVLNMQYAGSQHHVVSGASVHMEILHHRRPVLTQELWEDLLPGYTLAKRSLIRTETKELDSVVEAS